MYNKLIIGVLVFLVILTGCLGFYSYTLDQQIQVLSDDLKVMLREQAAQVSRLSDEVTVFRGDTLASITALEDETGAVQDEIGSLVETIEGTLTKVGSLQGEIAEVSTRVSGSIISADTVYESISRVTVSVSNGYDVIGTGFIFDSNDHLVTAHHVIEELTDIYIILSDGRSSKATVVGSSALSDVAVLTLDDEELGISPPVMADSSQVRIGEPVAAIGNPFDLRESLTSGIVSQKNRIVEIEYDSQTRSVTSLIQFDAAVNFGNSGGPLMNADGHIIGLVIARVDPEQGDGVYYAVSSNKVKRVATAIIEKGYYDYPWLGIGIIDITPEALQSRGLETVNGVIVAGIFPGSPAEASELQVDDVIVAIDGVSIRDIGQLTSYLGEHKSPDEAASLTVIRDSERLGVSVTLGKRPS